MTREEQVIEASQLYAKHQQKPFMDGARWADQNPINYDGKAMFYVLNKGHEQGYKDAIDKACEWLRDNLPLYWAQVNADNTDRFIRIFKKAMEEQE